jgi:hypothetical protein
MISGRIPSRISTCSKFLIDHSGVSIEKSELNSTGFSAGVRPAQFRVRADER